MDVRIFTEPQQGATYEELLGVARATERAGLDGFFRSDHFMAIGPSARADAGIGPTDAWVTLGALARETSRIRLGTLLTAGTFRHPGALAIAVAQVDEMSGGRVELGLGAGWYEAEHRAYGIPFPASAGERLGRLAEQLEVITGLWRTPHGERFSYGGRYYTLEESPALPKPRQSPAPPVIVGGRGTRTTPALAARFAAEWNLPFQTVEQAAAIFASLEPACAAVGRDPTSLIRSVALTTFVGEQDAEVAARARVAGRDPDALQPGTLAGTPEQLAETLARYAGIGVRRVYLQLLDVTDTAQVELIGASLAPIVADL